MKKFNILGLAMLSVASVAFTGCESDDPNTDITVITQTNTEKNDLDRWLDVNFREPYNIDVKYRYEDVESDMNYYLIPCAYKDAIVMSHLVKYLCVETYNEVAGTDFTCRYFPKMFFYVGSWEFKNNGTIVLGTAEGGRKIFLAGLNELDRHMKSADGLNTYYFKTIHHEFTHIMNQTKPIPPSYQLVNGTGYVADLWNTEPYNSQSYFLNAGFISAYAQHSYGEDFAEMLSMYITKSTSEWNTLVNKANADGKAFINQKLDIVRTYMDENFGIDIDDLRAALQRRQKDVVDCKVDLTDLTIK